MKHPEWIISHARTCLHSQLGDYDPNASQPPYTCMKDKGRPCALLSKCSCDIREEYPTRFDT